jgi:hypothetical protein
MGWVYRWERERERERERESERFVPEVAELRPGIEVGEGVGL